MKKNGFSLVELLGILTLIAVITLITIPSINYVVKQGKEKSYKTQVSSIELAISDYYTENKYNIDTKSDVSITLEDLKNDGYLSYDFRNPKNNKCFSNDNSFLIKFEDDKEIIVIDNLVEGKESDCGEFSISPSLLLLGNSRVQIGLGETYHENGFTSFDENGDDLSSNVVVSDNIDNSKIGDYQITYTITNNNLSVTRKRTIEVIDTDPPTIHGVTPLKLFTSQKSIDLLDGITTSDDSNEDVTLTTTTNLMIGIEGTYYIDYLATDSSNNTTKRTRIVNIYDSKKYEPHVIKKFEYKNDTFVDANSSFRNPIYNDKIATISFTKNKDISNNKVVSWDLSEKQDKSIMGWLVVSKDNSALYDLYINSDGLIQANPDSSYLFYDLPATKEINFDNFDTSEMINMNYMFRETAVTHLDLTTFDTSKVTNMEWTFEGGKSETIDLSSFDTSNVTTMSYSFRSLAVKNLDLSSFDTSNVISMYCMFNGNKATKLDLSNFNTENVRSMEDMFSACSATSIDVSSFDTSQVYSMYNMFCNLWFVTELNLTSFDTKGVTYMNRMFQNSQKLKNIYVSNDWVIAPQNYNMFGGCGINKTTLV